MFFFWSNKTHSLRACSSEFVLLLLVNDLLAPWFPELIVWVKVLALLVKSHYHTQSMNTNYFIHLQKSVCLETHQPFSEELQSLVSEGPQDLLYLFVQQQRIQSRPSLLFSWSIKVLWSGRLELFRMASTSVHRSTTYSVSPSQTWLKSIASGCLVCILATISRRPSTSELVAPAAHQPQKHLFISAGTGWCPPDWQAMW